MILTVVALYLLGTLVAGAVLSSRIKRVSDYLVAGRNLGLALTTASLAAVQIGAGVVLGGAEVGASSGLWPGMWYGLGCGLGLVLAGLFAAGRCARSAASSPSTSSPIATASGGACGCGPPLEHPQPARHLRRAVDGRGQRAFGLRHRVHPAVLAIGAVIFFSNVMSGMWGVVAADMFQVAIIAVGIPLTAWAAMSHAATRARPRPCWPRRSFPRAWARGRSS